MAMRAESKPQCVSLPPCKVKQHKTHCTLSCCMDKHVVESKMSMPELSDDLLIAGQHLCCRVTALQ